MNNGPVTVISSTSKRHSHPFANNNQTGAVAVNQYHHSIVLPSGAGISAESGIQALRDSAALRKDHDLEETATCQAPLGNPDNVPGVYYDRCHGRHKSMQPHSAHYTLAAFAAAHGGEFLLVTQNVDNLQECPGIHNLRHIHGELQKGR